MTRPAPQHATPAAGPARGDGARGGGGLDGDRNGRFAVNDGVLSKQDAFTGGAGDHHCCFLTHGAFWGPGFIFLVAHRTDSYVF